jgi:hypothetical protein
VGQVAADREARSGTRWWALLPPVLTMAVVVAVLAWSSGGVAPGELDAWLLGFALWNLAPALVMLGFCVAGAVGGGPVRAAVVAGLVLLGATAVAYVGVATDESSTAALAYLTLPLFGLLLVVVLVGVAVVARARSSR